MRNISVRNGETNRPGGGRWGRATTPVGTPDRTMTADETTSRPQVYAPRSESSRAGPTEARRYWLVPIDNDILG